MLKRRASGRTTQEDWLEAEFEAVDGLEARVEFDFTEFAETLGVYDKGVLEVAVGGFILITA